MAENHPVLGKVPSLWATWASHAIHSTHLQGACGRRELVLDVASVSVGADVQDCKANRKSTVVTWSSATTNSSAKDKDCK